MSSSYSHLIWADNLFSAIISPFSHSSSPPLPLFHMFSSYRSSYSVVMMFYFTCWLILNDMLIDTDWCWLVLTDADLCWLMLTDNYWFADWCLLMMIDAYWCADWCLLMLIDADWCSRKVQLGFLLSERASGISLVIFYLKQIS